MDTMKRSDVRLAVLTGGLDGADRLFDRMQSVITEERCAATKRGYREGYNTGWDNGYNHGAQDSFDENVDDLYNRGHADGCFDGWETGHSIGFRDGWLECDRGYQNRALDDDDFLLTCPMCGATELQSVACEDGIWIPGALMDGYEIDPLCGQCAVHVDDNGVYHPPATYPADPLAPPTPYHMVYIPHNTRP